MKDKKFIYGSIIAVVFLLTVGLTYAYFSLTISGNDVAETINVSTTKIGLIYTDGNEIKVDGIEPKWTTTKTITVENTGNEEAYYALGWQKLYNEIQKEELVIRSTCTSSGVTGGTCSSTDNVVIPQTSEVKAETNKVLYPYKENILILPGETHTYTVTIEFINYDDKAQNYNQGKKFYGTLGAAESSKPTFEEYLIQNYQTLGLTKISQAVTGNQNYTTTEYRYQGKTPNNYITFNDEENTWRIIGVFEVETPNTDGTYTKENKVKIVRESIGTGIAWNSVQTGTNYNDWTTATLMTTLNSGDYYNRTGIYASNGLTIKAKNQISTTKWYLGNVVWTSNDGNGNTKEIYTQERSTNIWNGNKQTWDGKVALIYPSDYMYASSECYNDDTKKGYSLNNPYPYSADYRSETCRNTNWLDIGVNYWNISPDSDVSERVIAADKDGSVDYVFANYTKNDDEDCIMDCEGLSLRQTVYLGTNVEYISGNGSMGNPFVIE